VRFHAFNFKVEKEKNGGINFEGANFERLIFTLKLKA